MNLRKTSLLSVVLLSATPFPDPNLLHSNGKDMHEALVFAVRSAEPKQLELFATIDPPKESDVLIQGATDDLCHSQPSSILQLSQVLDVPTVKSDSSSFLDSLHGLPTAQGGKPSVDALEHSVGHQNYSCNTNDIQAHPNYSESVTALKNCRHADTGAVLSALPSPQYAKGQADSKRLALDFILGPKGSGLSERVCARLIQSEAREQNTSLRSDYRQAFICVSLASKGNTEPFLSSSYAVHGVAPEKVWQRILENRKYRLGNEYHEWYSGDDLLRPDVPKFKKPPVYEPEPNERIAALISADVAAVTNQPCDRAVVVPNEVRVSTKSADARKTLAAFADSISGLPIAPEAGGESKTNPHPPSPAQIQKERLA